MQELLNALGVALMELISGLQSQINTISDSIWSLKKYKKWSGLITQAGADAPTTPAVFENDLSEPPVFEFVSDGKFRVTSPDFFGSGSITVCPQNQTMCKNRSNDEEFGLIIERDPDNSAAMLIQTIHAGSGVRGNGMLDMKYIEFLIYTD